MATYIKRKSGWLTQIRRKGHETVCRTFDTKAEAVLLSRKWDQGARRYPRRLTTILGECLKRYDAEVTMTKKGAEQERYRIALWLRDDLVGKLIGAVRSVEIAKWRDARIASGTSSGTVSLDLPILRKFKQKKQWVIFDF